MNKGAENLRKQLDAIDSHRDDPLLSVQQAARMLGMHRTSVYRWIIGGSIKAIQMPSGTYRIRKSEVEKYLVPVEIKGDD